MGSCYLSVVIPAYNEAGRILRTLDEVTAFLASQDYSWEVLVVDDGSTDETASLVQSYLESHPQVDLLRVQHGGKGWAVKHGMLAVTGEYRFLCDADLSMPIHQIERFLPPALEGYDVAIGSREVPGARRHHEPFLRHLQGRVFNGLVRLLAVPRLADTQCGFKCFRGAAAEELFPRQRLVGFGFDVEVLFLALQRGMRVVEVPIDWYYRPASKVRPVRDAVRMVADVLSVRWNHWQGRYGMLASSS